MQQQILHFAYPMDFVHGAPRRFVQDDNEGVAAWSASVAQDDTVEKRAQFSGAAQTKLSALFGSPVPLYFEVCG